MLIGVRHKVPGLPVPFFFRLYERDDTLKVQLFTKAGFDPAIVNAQALPAGLANDDQVAAFLTFDTADQIPFAMLVTADQIGATGPELFWYARTPLVYRHREGFGAAELKGLQAFAFTTTHDGQLLHPYNRFLQTLPAKDRRGSELRRMSRNQYLALYASTATTPLAQAVLSVCYNTEVGFWSDRPYDNDMDLAAFNTWVLNVFPELRLTVPAAIAASETATCSVDIVDPETKQPLAHSGDVYLEVTAGYLAKQRVHPNPSAEFKIRALDLAPGDTIKVKAGWLNYPGAAEAIIQVR